jgi:hypothetical protein
MRTQRERVEQYRGEDDGLVVGLAILLMAFAAGVAVGAVLL